MSCTEKKNRLDVARKIKSANEQEEKVQILHLPSEKKEPKGLFLL